MNVKIKVIVHTSLAPDYAGPASFSIGTVKTDRKAEEEEGKACVTGHVTQTKQRVKPTPT